MRRARLRANRLEGSLGALINESWIDGWIGRGHDGGWFSPEYLESIRRAFYQFKNHNEWIRREERTSAGQEDSAE